MPKEGRCESQINLFPSAPSDTQGEISTGSGGRMQRLMVKKKPPEAVVVSIDELPDVKGGNAK